QCLLVLVAIAHVTTRSAASSNSAAGNKRSTRRRARDPLGSRKENGRPGFLCEPAAGRSGEQAPEAAADAGSALFREVWRALCGGSCLAGLRSVDIEQIPETANC